MAARRTTGGNVTDLPTKVHFSLVVENENAEETEPFVAEIREGVTVTLTDPTELPVEQVAELSTPLGFLKWTCDDETRQILRKLSSKKFGQVMKAYFEHFGIDTNAGKQGGLGF